MGKNIYEIKRGGSRELTQKEGEAEAKVSAENMDGIAEARKELVDDRIKKRVDDRNKKLKKQNAKPVSDANQTEGIENVS